MQKYCYLKSFEYITGLSLPLHCAHEHYYTNSDYTLARVTKTTVLQR